MRLENLNKAQQEAVIHTDGPVMILAGAGSGKTRTLVSRIQYLLDEKHLSPFELLAVTFSNKAAREMRERISDSSGFELGALQVTTFHAFCARLLRNEANYLGLSRNFTIYDQGESKSVVKAILGRRGINLKELSPVEVQYYIDDLKNNGHYVGAKSDELLDDIDKDDVFYSYFLEYEAELHKSNAVDFGGLITGVLNLFDNFPEVLKRYQTRFKYIMVDEYQDTNRAQFKLIKLLSEKTRNICVVGDEDQSIYSWRGADIRNILDFEKIFPDAHLIKLEQNYRSSKNIIEAASHVISKNIQRKGKELWTDNDKGESIDVIECVDDRSESEFVGKEVQKLINSGVGPKDIAIFYRTNAQSRQLEDSLRSLRIAYKVVAGIKFYERKEIKDMLAYLRLIVNEKDSLALSRIINVPVRGIGATTLRKLENEAIKMQLSLWECLVQLVDSSEDFKHLKLSSKVRTALNSFVGLIQESKILDSSGEKPSVTYEKLLHESGYLEFLASDKSYESQARIENLEELLSGIKQYELADPKPSMTAFLETITLDTTEEAAEGELEEVSLMTIHGSKGLEYPYVLVTGLEETVFPSYRSLEDGEQAIEEERRLFYVAMTRAMTKLYLTFAQGRMLWGSIKFNGPSRFLEEVPKDYYTWHFFKKGRLKQRGGDFGSDIDYSDEYSQEPSYDEYEPAFTFSTEKIRSEFPLGTKVNHRLYGHGTVTETTGAGADEKVVIKFRDGIHKKFMVKFAPLEKV